MKSGIIFIVAGIMILSACAKDKNEDNILYIDTPQALIGSWNWLYTSGGIGGTTYTPQSTGETKRIEFDSDNNYKLYINNLLQTENKYKVEKGKTITSQDSVPILTGITGMRQSISFRTADTLILFDECYDCYEHHFNRIK